MPAPLYTEIAAGMRAFLDDVVVPGGAEYDDAFCQQYIEPAQRTLVAYLKANSVQRARARAEFTVPALTTTLDYSAALGGTAGPNVALLLPDEFDIPDQMFEAKVGGLNEDFVSMSGPNEIPRVPQLDTIRYWDWYDNLVRLLGAVQDKLVRLDFWAFLPAINPAGRIRSVASGNALIALAASDAAASKGQHELAARLATYEKDGTIGGRAGWELLQIITSEIKTGQSEPQRRRPYFGRDRYSNQDYWIRGRY